VAENPSSVLQDTPAAPAQRVGDDDGPR